MHPFVKFVLNSFKWIWRVINFIRELIVNLFVFLILLVAFGVYYQLQEKPVTFQSGALVLDIIGSVVEQPDADRSLRQLKRDVVGKTDKSQQNSMYEISQAIEQATYDDNISGLILSLNDFTGADLPALQYIGKYLKEFKTQGKPIYAIASSYDNSQYYLASFADKIYLEQQGSVNLFGLSAQNLYYKSLLENLKVNTHIFRVGTYKSAVEPFIRDNMSAEAKQNTRRWLNVMWQNYLADISDNRKLLPNQLVPDTALIIQRMQSVGGDSTQYAKTYRLVDEIASRAQFEQDMRSQFRWNYDSKKFNQISIYDYQIQPPVIAVEESDQIAIIFAEGAIVDGLSSTGYVGSSSLVSQLRQARFNYDVKAVVLRINSPGGSVTASEAIRNELLALDKPLVVSMGGVAASGGYWIATPANHIFASRNTITGSIGIFGMIPTFENSLQHIGVYTDGVATSPLAGVSLTKALPPEFKQLMQLNIENGYQSFLKIVAEARGQSIEQIDKIAQGQVWIGIDAKKNGLIDDFGDLNDAILKAAELAELDEYTLNWFYAEENLFDSWFGGIKGWLFKGAFAGILPEQLAPLQQKITWLDSFNDPQNRYIYCLDCADIR